jgi:hypothetical protein
VDADYKTFLIDFEGVDIDDDDDDDDDDNEDDKNLDLYF